MTNNFDLPILNLLNQKNTSSTDITPQLGNAKNSLILPRLEDNSRKEESSDSEEIEDPHRKSRLAGPTSKKVKFTKAEDAALLSLVQEYSTRDWRRIAEHMPPRTARQCRERWTNYVNPALSREPWTQEEDLLLIQKHAEVGNRWKIIEKYFPGRSKNNIKQRWAAMKDMMVTSDNTSTSTAGKTTITINYNSKPTRPANAPVSLQTICLMHSLQQQQKLRQESEKEHIPMPNLVPNDHNEIAPSIHKTVIYTNQPQTLSIPVIPAPRNATNDDQMIPNVIQSDPAVILNGGQIQTPLRTISLPTPAITKKLPVLPSINSAFIQPVLHNKPLNINLGSTGFSLNSSPQQQGPMDQFKFFDRILDQHEVYVTEIDKHDMWNFPEENYF